MKIGPLTLFERRHSNGTPISSYTVAAFHWSWSLTWRWVIVWQSGRISRRTMIPYFKAHRTYRGHPHSWLNFTAMLYLPVIGDFHIQSQPNMPKNKTRK